MNKAEELCHSSGPWKKHKYISKVGEGAKAVYKYAKKAASDPGSAIGTTQRKKWKYFEDRANVNAEEAQRRSEFVSNMKSENPNALAYRVQTTLPTKGDPLGSPVDADAFKNKQYEVARGYRRTANEAKNSYGKTPLGKIEGAAERGKKKIDKLFKSETKVTVKDTFTGKTRTPSKPKSAADTINIKQLSDKNKNKK